MELMSRLVVPIATGTGDGSIQVPFSWPLGFVMYCAVGWPAHVVRPVAMFWQNCAWIPAYGVPPYWLRRSLTYVLALACV